MDDGHAGWWAHALLHAPRHGGHAHAPKRPEVLESAAREAQIVTETTGTGCEWCDKTEQLPERLSFARFLERINTESPDPPALRRGEQGPAPAAPDGKRGEAEPSDAEPADRGYPELGDVQRPEQRVEHRVQTAYQVRMISPAGRYIDIWV